MPKTAVSPQTSAEWHAQAAELFPGGVNSPVRAFGAVGGTPLVLRRAEGCRVWDVEGREYFDYVSSWGAILLGHAHPAVNEAIARAAADGTSFGAPHPGEVALAEAVLERMPVLERVRFVNSGTEASQSALRLARAATGRTKILKFEGHYHGAVDALLVKAGSGVATLGLPGSAGVPEAVAAETWTLPFNDFEALENLFARSGEMLAAAILEPIAGNMGLVPPEPGFLERLRALCTQHGALMIVDEVMTGFRVARGGACERYGLQPDLVCLGKVIGGGLPVGAYGGRKEWMDLVAPLGPMYQAGTLSGNPLAMAAGRAAIDRLTPSVYERLEACGARFETGLRMIFGDRAVVQRIGSMLSVFFAAGPVRDFRAADASDKAQFAKLFHALLERGVALPPSALEAWFLNLAHDEAAIDESLTRFEAAWKAVRA